MPAVPSLRISGTWKTTVCGLFFLTFAVALGVSFSSFYAARDLFEPYIPPDVPDKVMQPPYVLQMPTLSTVGKQCTQPTKDRPNYYVCQWLPIELGHYTASKVTLEPSDTLDSIMNEYNIIHLGCYAYRGQLNQTGPLAYDLVNKDCEGDHLVCYTQFEVDMKNITTEHSFKVKITSNPIPSIVSCVNGLPVYYLWAILVALALVTLSSGVGTYRYLDWSIVEKEVTAPVGTMKDLIGFYFLGAVVPVITPLTLFFTNGPWLRYIGASFGSIAMLLTAGFLAEAVMFNWYAMMGLAFSTLIGLIWLIALCVWVQKVFLVLYDASPEAHFKTLEGEETVESWGTDGTTIGWAFCGLLLPATGTFFCICFAPLRGRWACWMGTAVAGFVHVWTCEVLILSLVRDLVAEIYCIDFIITPFEVFSCFTVAIFSTFYYYLQMRPHLSQSSSGKFLELSDELLSSLEETSEDSRAIDLSD